MNGIKSLARELPNYGRYGDDMVAHISSDEAKLLKSLGGAGTINPVTGLREYGLGDLNPFKAAKKVLSRFDDVVLQPVTGRIQDVVQSVAKATGPIGQIAATYYGGPLGAALYGGLAGEDGFNFKRGLMSGALAYGAQGLAEGVGAAGGAAPPPLPDPTAAATIGIDPSAVGATGLNASMGAGASNIGLSMPTDVATFTPPPGIMDRIGTGISNAYDTVTNPATYSNMGSNIADKTMAIPDKLSNLGSGISNLTSMDPAVRGAATEAFKASGATLSNTALPIMMGSTGIAAIDEQERIKKQQEEELAKYNARVKRGVASATEAMRLNPYNFAAGGDVNYSMDDAGYAESGLGNLRRGLSFAAGGMPPRFLSGGGDGMSDSIKATINNDQPARLADGEFVIPADVVSHLGNGSSKAGAKKLYSMMDKVRHARTGNKKQGRQINPNKFLPA